MNKNKSFINSPIKIALFAVIMIAILTITAFLIAGNVLSRDVDDKIAIEKCVDIILSDLDLEEKEVSGLSATYGNKGSSPIYKIQFSTEDYEFSYDVNAHSGEILSFTKDKISIETEPTVESEKDSDSNESNDTASIIDIEQAKSIALSSANLDYNDVIFTKSKLDKDDALYVYEIEFDYNNLSYEYEIDAYSGKILDSEIDD